MDIQKLCAVLSLQAYSAHENDNPVIPGEPGLPVTFEGYTRIDNAGPNHDDYQDFAACGFYAEAWIKGDTGELIVAFRGTDFNAPNLLDFWDANIPLGFGYTDAEQWVQAQAFVDKIIAENAFISQVTFTGHSLGGGLAALASMKYGHESYVFSPAPFKSVADSFMFVPDGLDPAHEAVLRSAVTAYEATDIWPTSLPGLAAAVAARDALVESRYDADNGLIHTSRVAGEVLGEFFANPLGAAELMTYLGATGQSVTGLAAALFPAAADTDIDIGGSSISMAESLARHGMALHLLLLDRAGFAEILQDDASLRTALLSSAMAPVSTATVDASSVRDMGIVFRSMYLDVDFYQSFMGASNILHVSGQEQGVKDAFAALLVQKASLHADGVRTGTNGIFDPLASTTGNAVIIGGIDVVNEGARNEHENLVSHVIADVHFRELLAQALVDEGHATTSYALALATTTLGINLYDFEPGAWSLPWAWMAAADGKGAVNVDLSAYEGTLVFGSGHNDTIKGSAWADFIYGGDGDDTIEGGAGADVLIGGAGNDTVSYLSSPSGVNVNLSVIDPQTGGHAEGDVLLGIENVRGSQFNDVIRAKATLGDIVYSQFYGEGGDDVFYDALGAQRYRGGDGDDLFIYLGGKDKIYGDAGYDTIDVTAFTGSMTAKAKDMTVGDIYMVDVERIVSNPGQLTTHGALDIIPFLGVGYHLGGDAATVHQGVSGLDRINYSASPEAIVINLSATHQQGGYAEGDVLISIESVIGTAFGDAFHGSSGHDVFHGMAGNDIFYGSLGQDIFYGGSGHDRVSYAFSPEGVTVDLNVALQSGSGHAAGDRLYDIEEVFGSSFDDVLYLKTRGAGVPVTEFSSNGGGGHDIIFDAEGNHRYKAGIGNDLMVYAGGADKVYGGDGFDVFDISRMPSSAVLHLDNSLMYVGGVSIYIVEVEQIVGRPGQISISHLDEEDDYVSSNALSHLGDGLVEVWTWMPGLDVSSGYPLTGVPTTGFGYDFA